MPPDPEDILDLFANVEDASFAGLALGTKPAATNPLLLQMQVTDDVAESFKNGFVKLAAKYAGYNENGLFELRDYEPNVPPEDQQLFVLDPNEHPDLAATINAALEPGNLPLASDQDEVPWRKIQLQARVFSLAGEPIVLLRKATTATLMKRKGKLAVIFRDGVLDLLEEEGILLDEQIDAIYWSGQVYMARPSAVETLFRFYDDLQERADEIIDQIHATIPIEGVDMLKAAAGAHYQMLRKIHHISQQPYLADITMDDIERVIEELDLKIAIKGEGSNRKIAYDESDKWAILRLLDDDYLRSELTQRVYEVKDSSKHALSEE